MNDSFQKENPQIKSLTRTQRLSSKPTSGVTGGLSIHIHKRESREISKSLDPRFEGCMPPRKVNKGSMGRSFYVDCP